MLFAPLPPPVGGISSISAMLHRELADSPGLLFRQPRSRQDGLRGVLARAGNLARLFASTLRVVPGGRILLFASSRTSFWEKVAWTSLIVLLRRVAVVVMVAGDFPEAYASEPAYFRALTKWLMTRDRVIIGVQSQDWESRYKSIFPGAATCRVAATFPPEFLQRCDRTETAGSLTALYVGWIIVDKGVVDLLDAIRIVADEFSGDVKFRLVGPLFGKDEFWAEQLSRRGLESVASFIGPINSRADLVKEYGDADVFVFPSHFEGFPVALLEAIASALPCVATDVGGVRDILDGGRAGVIVPPKSPRQLADALLRVLREPALRDRLGAVAASRAQEAFSYSECIASYAAALGIA